MSLTLLVDNVFSRRFTTLSSNFPAAIPAGMELSYLQTEEPSDKARISTLDPRKTTIYFSTSGVPVTIDGFALVNHNLVPGDLIRFIGSSIPNGGLQNRSVGVIDGIVSSSNIVGTATNVDESVDSLDSAYIGPNLTTALWEVIFSFAGLASTPVVGANKGQFILAMKRSGTSSPTTYPKLSVDLLESGSFRATLGYRAVVSTTDVLYVFPFNFEDLTSPNGINIQCRVRSSSIDTSAYAELNAINLYYETAPVDYLSEEYDSGYLVIPEALTGDSPTKSYHHLMSSTWINIVSGSLTIISDQSTKDPDLGQSSGIPVGVIDSTPLSYIEAGVLVGAEKEVFESGIQPEGPQVAIRVEEISGTTVSGQTYGADSFKRRICDPTSIVVSRSERDYLMDLFWKKGKSGAFYAILETGLDYTKQLFSSFWCTFSGLSVPRQVGGWDAGDEVKYSMTIALDEKL